MERLRATLADRYTLERELGSGGMATVYLAEDVRHHRKVALKVLRPELAASLGADRFLREIETSAQFQHPHILPLLDSGEAGGFLYYVMPYVEGESLRSRLGRRLQESWRPHRRRQSASHLRPQRPRDDRNRDGPALLGHRRRRLRRQRLQARKGSGVLGQRRNGVEVLLDQLKRLRPLRSP